jgi:hypothetical protein
VRGPAAASDGIRRDPGNDMGAWVVMFGYGLDYPVDTGSSRAPFSIKMTTPVTGLPATNKLGM